MDKYALAAGVDVDVVAVCGKDDNRNTSLHFAASEGHDNMASSLLLKGSEEDALNSRGGNTFFWSVCRGHLPVAEISLRCWCRPQRPRWPPAVQFFAVLPLEDLSG